MLAFRLALVAGALWNYLTAAWLTFWCPPVQTSVWCQDVGRCRKPHRLVMVAPPNKPIRFGLKHLEGV